MGKTVHGAAEGEVTHMCSASRHPQLPCTRVRWNDGTRFTKPRGFAASPSDRFAEHSISEGPSGSGGSGKGKKLAAVT